MPDPLPPNPTADDFKSNWVRPRDALILFKGIGEWETIREVGSRLRGGMGDSTSTAPAVPAPGSGAGSGLEVEHKGTAVRASEGVVHDITGWMDRNPIEFGLILLFLAFWVWQTRIGKRERSHHGLEFEKLRRNIRDAPPARKRK